MGPLHIGKVFLGRLNELRVPQSQKDSWSEVLFPVFLSGDDLVDEPEQPIRFVLDLDIDLSNGSSPPIGQLVNKPGSQDQRKQIDMKLTLNLTWRFSG